MTSPLVSICIPTYNRPELLRRAVCSCLAQTYGQFELIITDNSDNDATAKMIAGFKDPRILYFKNDRNLGGLGNIERGISLAKGKYVKLLMDDDLLKPKALELMVEAFEQNPSVGVVMAPMDLIDEDDNRIFPYFYVVRKMYYRYRYQRGNSFVNRRKALKDFLVNDYPCCVPSGVLYRAECFQKLGTFDSKCGFAVDLEMCMRIAAHYDFYYIDQVLSSWRWLPECHTSSLHAKGFDVRVFYYATRKTLDDKAATSLFADCNLAKLERESVFFCSRRAMLNALAGMRSRNLKLVTDTLKTINQEDPFFWNKLRIPFYLFKEVFISFIPPAKPLPLE